MPNGRYYLVQDTEISDKIFYKEINKYILKVYIYFLFFCFMKDIYYLALLHSLWITHKKLHLIFGEGQWEEEWCYEQFYEKLSIEYLRKYSMTQKDAEKIITRKQKITLQNIVWPLEKRDVSIISIYDENYPEELKNISQIPYVLYLRGTIWTEPKIAVVWARKITSYWSRVIEHIIPEVSKYFTIVSGGAFWCDTTAHNETLAAWNSTISVIWTAIDEDYPTGNKRMYDTIVEKWWAVVSIFPVGVPGNAYNFPIRNEIVAGLSVWILVVEAQERSWSLITAKLSLDLGKDLFAIPWEIFKSNSIWCNNLIKNWEAKSVTRALDILEEYNFSTQWWTDNIQEKKTVEFSDEIEKQIYNYLLLEGFTIDELTKKMKLDISTLSLKLSMLELQWHIKKSLWWKFEVK